MCYMFQNCKTLEKVNLSSFDTHKVTKMIKMFSNCERLLELDLSNFNTSNVTDMFGMFMNCFLLRFVNLSNFDTSNVKDMCSMFAYCESLTALFNISHFDIYTAKKHHNIKNMFKNCNPKIIPDWYD